MLYCGHHSDLPARHRSFGHYIAARNQHAFFGMQCARGADADDRGFAGAVRPQHAKVAASRNSEMDSIDRNDALSTFVDFCQRLNGDYAS